MKIEDIKIGTKVNYYSWIKESGKKAKPLATEIASEVMGNGEGAICKVNGVSGGVYISHLELRQ